MLATLIQRDDQKIISFLIKFTKVMAMLYSLLARRRFGPQPLRKPVTSGIGLDDMSLAWPAVVQLLVFFYSGIQQN